jgi:hypothetical protein
MTRKIFAVLLLSLAITACDSSSPDNNSNANSNTPANTNAQVSPTPVAPTPEPSASVQTQLKPGDKVKVTINGTSKDATVVSADEKTGKVTVKFEGQNEEKTVPIGDVTKKELVH